LNFSWEKYTFNAEAAKWVSLIAGLENGNAILEWTMEFKKTQQTAQTNIYSNAQLYCVAICLLTSHS